MSQHPIAVIGGGQAGLAMAYELVRRGRDVVVLDAASAAGEAWRTRWDSLRLFTPARYSALPGMAFPADPDHYPSKDEVADYLSTYARTFDLPVRHSTRVERVEGERGAFEIATSTGTVQADQVVIATGPFQVPTIPGMAAGVAASVVQLHTSEYHRTDQVPAGAQVLVIGGGNSGVQIASELAGVSTVHLATGDATRYLPQRPFGRDLFRYFDAVGAFGVGPDSLRGRRVRRHQMVIGTSPRGLRRDGVTLRPRVTELSGRRARFADGSTFYADVVLWATGMHSDHSFIRVPDALDGNSRLRQRAGVSPVPGLFTIGMPWQRTRGSALLGFVGRDAGLLAERIVSSRTTAVRQPVLAA